MTSLSGGWPPVVPTTEVKMLHKLSSFVSEPFRFSALFYFVISVERTTGFTLLNVRNSLPFCQLVMMSYICLKQVCWMIICSDPPGIVVFYGQSLSRMEGEDISCFIIRIWAISIMLKLFSAGRMEGIYVTCCACFDETLDEETWVTGRSISSASSALPFLSVLKVKHRVDSHSGHIVSLGS